MGLSDAEVTFYTSWLYLPWVIKPLWSPFLDLIKTKRWWIIIMQLLVGAAFAGVALACVFVTVVVFAFVCAAVVSA